MNPLARMLALSAVFMAMTFFVFAATFVALSARLAVESR